MLPNGWEITTVGKACAIRNNLRQPISSEERDLIQGQFPYFGPTGILGYINHYKIDEEFVLIGEDGDHFLKFKDKEMTLLYSGKANVNNHAHIVTNSEQCLAQWFHLFFMHRDLTSFLTRQGAKRYKLTKASLEKLPLTLPPLSEQKKIAQILSTWDKAITTTEQLIANSQQQKKALMQQLLTGKERLLDDNGVRFSGEWTLAEIGEFLSESRISSPNNDPSKRLTVRLNLKGIEPREFRGTEAIDATAHFVRSAGQFIYGKQNIHKGAFGIIPNSLDGFETSQDLPAFDFSGKCDSTWFFHFMSQEHFFNSLEDKMSGTGSKRLNPKTFLKLKVLSPQLVEQQKIASVLSSADREIELLQSKLRALKQEKKALMQQLLTGKRRVKVD